MRKFDKNNRLFSPSDLITFLGCRHATFLDFKYFHKEIPPPGRSKSNQFLQKEGSKHEKNYLHWLRSQNKKIIEIPESPSLKKSINLTKEALKSGADIIYQAHLHNEFWHGYADFLIRIDAPSSLGSYSYQVIDTKLTKSPEPKHIIQLCAYTELLGNLQNFDPKQMVLVVGDNQQHSFVYKDFEFYYKIIKNNFEKYAQSPPSQSYPEPCEHCKLCRWQERCNKQWQADDHLSLVANIKRSEIDHLNKAGIQTVSALSDLADNTLVEEINPQVLKRLKAQARLQIYKQHTGKEKYEILMPISGKGFERLPLPDEGDLFFDMEGDPLYPQGLEYLFGIYFQKDNKWVFRAFWAHDHQEEENKFKCFMSFLTKHLEHFPNAHIYHYNHYENTALKRLACRYGTCEDQLDNLLRERKFVDLYKVVRESILISESSYSIKDLEAFYMNKRSSVVKTAMDSIDIYHQWLITRDYQLLEEIEKYNQIDCISASKLRDWLISIKPRDTCWFKKEEEAKKTKSISSSKHEDREIRYKHYQKLLKSKINNPDLSERLINLLEYHNREAKPQYWSIYDRQDKFNYEIIEDPECIGNLTLVEEPVPEKRSLIYTYRFPSQEFKLQVGDDVLNTESTKGAGKIIELDEEQNLIKIKLGKNNKLPENLSIGSNWPMKTKSLREALYRVADDVVNATNRYLAVLDILIKNLPRIHNKAPGQPIISSNNLQDEILKAINSLDNSYLFIQGPPGTGKTYTSSHIIVELIKLNKKIGVSSNSHKAIHNLLNKIEKVALAAGIHFNGIKRSHDDKNTYNGKFIKSDSKKDHMPSDCSLYAGTVRFFAEKFFETNPVDYLFIDEAGQVCVANVVAMGTATKNIILIGDQMQLAQPMKGIHPGDSGLSILDFLLGDHATVSPSQGVFLKETYRMRPRICNFISKAFYEERLSAHPSVYQYELSFDKINLPTEGICIIPVSHEGCSQKSVEEGQIITSLYQTLLQQKLKVDDKIERKLTSPDILVVSPYNIQVNYLRSILPEGAQVGTIDKFQGQEAAIVLVSMTTSSAEDLPRNIEFLYSKNRLNVAISRARCLTIVVFNTNLLNTPCKTIDQMKLVNSFCWLYDYGKKLDYMG